MTEINKNYEKWLEIFDKKQKKLYFSLTEEEKVESFEKKLKFGTAGIRGTEGLGTGHMNEQTVYQVAVGIKEYLVKNFEKPRVIIGYDTRLNSKKYEEIFKRVLSSSNVEVFCNKSYSPTSLITFSVKYLKLDLGIVVTSSHNPKEYNGIKIVNGDGIQIDNKVADKIAKEIDKVQLPVLIEEKINKNYIYKFPKSTFTAFESMVKNCGVNNQEKVLNITYTSLNGTGIDYTPKYLKDAGFLNVKIPKIQAKIDPTFKTCTYPNPEFIEPYGEALKISAESDIIVANDPDADRLGIMARKDGEFKLLNGNEVGIIFTYYYLTQRERKFGDYIVSTVVTSPTMRLMAKHFKVKIFETLTGFKNIGKKVQEQEQKNNSLVVAFEESCGYVLSNKLRDKDGISGAYLMCEIANYLKLQEKTLFDYLDEIYEQVGGYDDLASSIKFNSMDEMDGVINNIRKKLPKKIGSKKITKVIDYSKDVKKELTANFIEFQFGDDRIIVRPSGTEPKIKFYCNFKKGKKSLAEATKCIEDTKELIQSLI